MTVSELRGKATIANDVLNRKIVLPLGRRLPRRLGLRPVILGIAPTAPLGVRSTQADTTVWHVD